MGKVRLRTAPRMLAAVQRHAQLIEGAIDAQARDSGRHGRIDRHAVRMLVGTGAWLGRRAGPRWWARRRRTRWTGRRWTARRGRRAACNGTRLTLAWRDAQLSK